MTPNTGIVCGGITSSGRFTTISYADFESVPAVVTLFFDCKDWKATCEKSNFHFHFIMN